MLISFFKDLLYPKHLYISLSVAVICLFLCSLYPVPVEELSFLHAALPAAENWWYEELPGVDLLFSIVLINLMDIVHQKINPSKTFCNGIQTLCRGNTLWMIPLSHK